MQPDVSGISASDRFDSVFIVPKTEMVINKHRTTTNHVILKIKVITSQLTEEAIREWNETQFPVSMHFESQLRTMQFLGQQKRVASLE